jgi:peptidoglycan/LPS O-acetylase OafA/YrhL
MNRSIARNALLLIASVFMLASTFHQPLGLPEGWELPLLFAAGICLLALYLLQRRTSPVATSLPTPKRLWFFVVLAALICIAGFFLAPFIGPPLSVPLRALVSVISFIFIAGIIWLPSRKRNSSTPPRLGIILVILALVFFALSFVFTARRQSPQLSLFSLDFPKHHGPIDC